MNQSIHSGDRQTPDMSRRTLLQAAALTVCGASGLGPVASRANTTDTAVVALRQKPSTSWPSFRNGPDQRGIAGCAFAEKPELKWEFKSPDGWVGTVAIAGDRVYAPALEGKIYCLDLQTGKVIWHYRSIESADPKKFAPGFKAAPTVAGDRVYVGDEDGVVHALQRDTGKQAWTFATNGEIAGGIAMLDDRLLVASHDSFLYCLNADGSKAWDFQTRDRINCTPAVAESNTFLSGCDSSLRVIDLLAGTETREVPLDSYLIASPAIVDDLLYVGSHDGDFFCVNWKTGEIVWRYAAERPMSFFASAAVTDELVLIGSHDRFMHAIDRLTGKPRWTTASDAKIESSAAVVDTRVFYGSRDGYIYGANLADGKVVWKYSAGKPITAGIAIGEERLVVGEDESNGRLLCFG